MIDIPVLLMNNGWKPCFPGGDNNPADDERVLALFHVHEGNEDKLRLDCVVYLYDGSGNYYWNDYCRCTVHPLCWHPLPDLPAFITGPEEVEPDYIPFNGTD